MLLTMGSAQVLADTQCSKSADGEVTCQRVDEDSALDSETTDQEVDHPTMDATDQQSEQKAEEMQGGNVGDKSTQSGDPGITY